MANRDYFRKLAQETLQIVSDKQYKFGNRMINLFVPTRNIYYKNFEVSDKILEGKQQYRETRYEVKNESVIKTIHDLREYELSLGVLNFASAYHPGGGFINGAIAQEEVLAYCSNLYNTLNEDRAPLYYKNNKEANSNTYTDGLVITNNIFFRDCTQFWLVSNKVRSFFISLIPVRTRNRSRCSITYNFTHLQSPPS